MYHIIRPRRYTRFLTALSPKIVIDLQFVRTQTQRKIRGQVP
jgi:hypothetical protein